MSRLVSTLAADGPRALKAIRAARAAARERAWELAGNAAPGGDGTVTVDLDATIVIAHSEKEQATPTWKKTFGFHPMTAWADHGDGGNGEPLAIVLRAGNAGSNTAADHIEAARLSLAQLPRRLRGRVLVRADSGGGTHEFLAWLAGRSRPLHYSIGMTITEDMQAAILKVPARSWTPAYDGDGQARDGAWVADVTGLLDLTSWPAGMRVIVRKERPHPGAQLRFTDIDGHRFTAFATDANRGQLAGPGAAAPPPGQVRGPDPVREGHRPAEPPAEGLRAEPAVVRDRRAGLRPARLDPADRPGRRRSPLGTQAPAPADLRRRGPACQQRTTAPAPPRRAMALVRGHRGAIARLQALPAGLTSRNNPTTRKGEHPGPVEPRPPTRQPASQARPAPENHPQPNTSGQQTTDAKHRG